LEGHDPYSSSKACSELITTAYRDSFFKQQGKYVSTVRAGNVIGGGDWQVDRLVPDCIRALQEGKPVGIRNPKSIRPWQFVLEPLRGYLMLAGKMWADGEKYSGAWNFAPERNSVTVRELANRIIYEWGSGNCTDLSSTFEQRQETRMLRLDSYKAFNLLGWKTAVKVADAVKYTVDWHKNSNPDYEFCTNQIQDYLKDVQQSEEA
jgi:CDP-glucose 4,6-dehydratase